MINRINFLGKEEQKFLKKILKSREDAEKMQNIKTGKIGNL